MLPSLAPEPSKMGTVRVLMVEDDVEQQKTLKSLFALANEKNEGIVTFEVNGMFSPRAILKRETGIRAHAAEGGLFARAPVCLAAVQTAAAALEEAKRNGERHFHLILLDMILPDQNGCEVLPQLRAAVGNDVAIVMASSDSHVRTPRPARTTRASPVSRRPCSRAPHGIRVVLSRSPLCSCAYAAARTPFW